MVEADTNLKLREMLVAHRNSFSDMFLSRYKELLPTLITYRNTEATSIDFLKIEVALRNNYDIVIGETAKGNLQVLGYLKSQPSSEDPAVLFNGVKLTQENITFVIPKNLQKKKMQEISHDDNCATGDFVVLRNKTLNYFSDTKIIQHYVNELMEIVLSRYSITMQIKIMTFIISEVDDAGAKKITSDMYLGIPYSNVSEHFDPDEQIIQVNNTGAASSLEALKKEYQHKISELNNMIGINSLAVDKASGVSDTEAKSNSSFTTSNANIYLSARNNPLKKLNKRFGENIEAIYNDQVSSEIALLGGATLDNSHAL